MSSSVPHTLPIQPELLIRGLTLVSLGGLLLATGLRLEVAAVVAAIRSCRWSVVLPLNFIAVPLLACALARAFALPPEYAAGMLLLAAAPFAPVVPVFVKMARGDLALAAGLTAIFPLFAIFLTPLAFDAGFAALGGAATLRFSYLNLLTVLSCSVSMPLLAGMVLRFGLPGLASRLLRPLDVLAETAGAVSLAFVTWVESGTLLATGWKPLMAFILAGELSFCLGYVAGGPGSQGRRVIAFGTANRNIALAILIAVESFAGTQVAAVVVANGLALILLGLLHAVYYRRLAERGRLPVAVGRKRLP
ncbi:bile acid:sodium symporter family protein [Methylococcus sp. BF19-07]|uniref:bile acid:sodium symporter family protein n=1 Tax=Methylococcus sp. BF19-07 TaxID=2743472 RepID=UPI001E463044|nr:bile acid:sodium symporter [Methylococcus sp. BF19-07]